MLVQGLVGGRANLGRHELDLFLVGLLSSMDAILGRPLPEVLEQLAVSPPVREALLGDRGPLGQVYALARAYERGDWEAVYLASSGLGLSGAPVIESYLQALKWADDTSSQVHKVSG